MKKLIALMFAALLALTPALAELNENEPTPEPTAEAPFEFREVLPETGLPVALPDAGGEAIEMSIDGERVKLSFDTSAQYSSISGGLVQASFYGYSADGVKLYELYMIFPDTAQPGMVITPTYSAIIGEESSVVLIVSDIKSQEETYYFSSLMDGAVYPENSDYAISISGIDENDGATTFSGTLSARLIALDMATGEEKARLEIAETPFNFTIGANSERHIDPIPTEAPDNKDMRKT